MSIDRGRRVAERFLRRLSVEFHVLVSPGERHGSLIIQDMEGHGEAMVPDVGTQSRCRERS